MTTVADLHKALGQLIEIGMGENELRLAVQPNYPLAELVDGLWFDEEKQRSSEENGEEPPVVFIVSGGGDAYEPYAPSEAFLDPSLFF